MEILPYNIDVYKRQRFASLRAIYQNFSEADAGRIKEIESVTNHDVKDVYKRQDKCWKHLSTKPATRLDFSGSL